MNMFLIQHLKPTFLIITFVSVAFFGVAQEKSNKVSISPTGFSKSVSAGINISIPEFSETHPIGIGVGLTWSKNRLGLMEKKPTKVLGFIAEGGIDYYFGSKVNVSSFPYQYNNFTYLHTYGGIIYNLCKKGNINLTTGPALGLEGGYTTFFWGVNLCGAYYINKKIAITPGIHFMKDPESYDPLLSGSIKASFAF